MSGKKNQPPWFVDEETDQFLAGLDLAMPAEEPPAKLWARIAGGMEGLDLATRVSTREAYTWGNPNARHHIVAYYYGIKRNILRLFGDADCRITVVPSDTAPDAVLRPSGHDSD